ncbi:MAG: alpha-E domain-containing protein [Candidatus Lindowbacteria bacterium]|nr:alpha-E domain-containing protein [Candidatus Lindowbacteria bacterium]
MGDISNVTPRSAAYRIFWFGRQIERAENNARLIDTIYYRLQESGSSMEDSRAEWESILKSLGLWEVFLRTGKDVTSEAVVEYVIVGQANPSSLLRCIELARDNANGAVPDEVFVQLNKIYLKLKKIKIEDIWKQGLHEFIQDFVHSIHTVGGSIDRIWA